MMARFFFFALSSSVLCLACSAADREASDGTSAEQALGGQGWHRVVQCDGAHVDSDSGLLQLVVEDRGASDWLRSELDRAVAHDPFAQPTLNGANDYGAKVRTSSSGELLVEVSSYDSPQSETMNASGNVTRGSELRVDLQRYSWDQGIGNDTYRRNNDLKVRFVRNGWHDRACDNGMGGGYETYCWDTGGWNEWEIANWIFRGCHNVP